MNSVVRFLSYPYGVSEGVMPVNSHRNVFLRSGHGIDRREMVRQESVV